MDIQNKFQSMGANFKRIRDTRIRDGFSVDVRRGVFEVKTKTDDIDVSVLKVDKADRHLLLMVKEDDGDIHKFLCGHDERDWFVAGVDRSAVDVKTAKELLKPVSVRHLQAAKGIKDHEKGKRRTKAYVRQGEWFFIPLLHAPSVDERYILKNEPITRRINDRISKPHIAEYLYRSNVNTVYVRGDETLSEFQYRRQLKDGKINAKEWRQMASVGGMFVKGKISHPDHKTIYLPTWHRVEANREISTSRVMFLD